MKRAWAYRLGFLVIAATAAGCVSIPPEAPELSGELGKRIAAIEASNLALLHAFFDQKRAELDEFIEETWVPTFAEEFFEDPVIANAWQIIVAEDDAAQRLRFITEFGTRLQAKINEKRLELVQPLDELERRMERHIRGEYEQAKAINNAITSLLLSSSEVVENRNRYLEMLGITDETVGEIIDDTDEAVANLLGKSQDAASAVNAAEAFKETIESLIDRL